MLDPVNSETFVTWDDSRELTLRRRLGRLVLFLHREQKDIAKRDLAESRGAFEEYPAAAKRVSWSIAPDTWPENINNRSSLSRSPRAFGKLLDTLIGTLCGVERSHITTSTMTALAKDLIRDLHPKSERWYTMANPERSTDISRKALAIVRNHAPVCQDALKKLGRVRLATVS